MTPESNPALSLPVAFVEEGVSARWGRRAVMLPLYFVATAAVCALLPVLLPVAAAFDLVGRRRFAATRCLLMVALYLLCESAGIVTTCALWLVRLLTGMGREREQALYYALQRWWAEALLAGASRIFGLRLEVEGDEPSGEVPLLVFVRHASLADTLLPARLVTRRHGIPLLYVLKRELLWDPCLDLVGNRLPNVFVRRASGDSGREIDAIRRLAQGLRPAQGVLIYPEGTRFSPRKRERAMARLAEGRAPERAERLRGLRHVLPPHLGGPLALLEAAPGADVLFVAHTGLEGAATVREVWNGALIDRTVRVGFRRVRRASIPDSRAERGAWLDAQWLAIDDWIERNAC